jgi:signal transduction histidine kinase
MRLRQQLMLSYLPLLLIPILVIGVITRNAAEYGLTLLVTAQGNRQATVLANRFAAYYTRYHSWDGVSTLFDESLPEQPFPSPPVGMQMPQMQNGQNGQNGAANNPGSGQQNGQGAGGPRRLPLEPAAAQIILADSSGLIIAANTPEAAGRSLSAQTIARGVPIYSNNQQVAVIVVGAALGVLDEAQQQLLDTVNTALILAGVLSAGVTLVVGLWLSGQISAPIAALTRGVRVLASGQWSQHIPIYGKNELGELTQAFNHMADDLVQQQTLRKQLMADIAHDLRTPLSVMTLEIEGIKAGLQTPEDAAQSLQDEVEWLSRLVDDVHTLSLIDAGQLTVQPEPTDLGIFLESVYKHWRITADQQHRQLLFEGCEHLPIVMIDPPRMRQVLGNLINNALQHTSAETCITLQAESDAQHSLIRVIDNGQGIPAEALPHLFERFYRVDRSRSRKMTSGSGLGLSIAYQLTLLQNGTLNVESTAGQGTTFTIHLPVSTPPQH